MPGDPNILAGQIPTAADLRALGSWTLLLSGTASIPSSTATDTTITTMAVVEDTSQITYTLNSGVLTLPDGGFFLVSVLGSFGSSTNGTTRLICAEGSTFGAARLAPVAPAANTTGHGANASATMPIRIEAGETITVTARQDSGGNLSCTANLGLTLLASPT